MKFENLIGLTLEDAREWLQRDETTGALSIRIVETAPPARPVSTRAPRKNADATTRAPRPETNFGGFRVLRARYENNAIELTVARETLRGGAKPI